MENHQDQGNTANHIALQAINTLEPMSDWLLRYIADAANNRDLQMGLTLQVHGQLVSGTLVSGQTYFEGITRNIADALGDKDETRAIAGMFEQMNQAVQDNTGGEGQFPIPAYIHLKDARIFSAGNGAPIPNGQGVWWRGRLSQVSGFFFGALSV